MGDQAGQREDPEPQDVSDARGLSVPLSRSEAVRRALMAGFEAAEEGTAYIRKEFGIELSTSLFLATKATERKKGWAKNGKPGRKQKQSPGLGDVARLRDARDDEEDLTN